MFKVSLQTGALKFKAKEIVCCFWCTIKRFIKEKPAANTAGFFNIVKVANQFFILLLI